MINNAWNLDGKNSTDSMAYAGSQRKVCAVSARDMWRLDHHKNLFGTNKETPFAKGKANDWQTTGKANSNGDVYAANSMQGAGSSTFKNPADYKMQFMSSS